MADFLSSRLPLSVYLRHCRHCNVGGISEFARQNPSFLSRIMFRSLGTTYEWQQKRSTRDFYRLQKRDQATEEHFTRRTTKSSLFPWCAWLVVPLQTDCRCDVPILPSQRIIWQRNIIFINDLKLKRCVGATTAILAADRKSPRRSLRCCWYDKANAATSC